MESERAAGTPAALRVFAPREAHYYEALTVTVPVTVVVVPPLLVMTTRTFFVPVVVYLWAMLELDVDPDVCPSPKSQTYVCPVVAPLSVNVVSVLTTTGFGKALIV